MLSSLSNHSNTYPRPKAKSGKYARRPNKNDEKGNAEIDDVGSILKKRNGLQAKGVATGSVSDEYNYIY